MYAELYVLFNQAGGHTRGHALNQWRKRELNPHLLVFLVYRQWRKEQDKGSKSNETRRCISLIKMR